MKQVLLLTGRPGTGKTSLIKQAASRMKDKAGGFYTEEIRTRGKREGFRLITLDGEETVLAHTGIRSAYRVSRYGVDIEALDRVGVPALRRAAGKNGLVVVDEIGRMELFSKAFRETVLSIIDNGERLLGTVMLAPEPWTDALKLRPEVSLIDLKRDSFERVLAEVLEWLETNQP
jgi:nucleoside-triphosphatase